MRIFCAKYHSIHKLAFRTSAQRVHIFRPRGRAQRVHVELRTCFGVAVGTFRRAGSIAGGGHTRWRVLVRLGRGTPLGIAAGALTLTMLRSAPNAVAAPPFANDLATGLILFAVAVSDAPFLMRRVAVLGNHFRRTIE